MSDAGHSTILDVQCQESNQYPIRRGTQMAKSTETERKDTAFTFRLPREEMEALENAANKAGLSIAEYLRKSVAMRPALTVLARPQFNLSVNLPYVQYGALVTWSETQSDIVQFHATSNGQINLPSC